MRGHWIVYRRYDLTQTSEFWDEVYRSGVDGPAYKYIDIPILTRRDPRYQPDMAESSTNIGFLPGGQYVYYFEWDVIPSRIDQIFEINWNDNSIAPHLDEIQTPYVDKFNIKEVFPHRGDDGQPAFWTCFVNLDRINY